MGLSGRLAGAFQRSALTPLLALLGLLLGLFAVLVTSKEEEPQIDVTFADIFIPYPGATPKEVEALVTNPAEQVISELDGLDTLYSFSRPDGALLIAIFEVGKGRNDAIVNLYNQIYANLDRLPKLAGVGQPLIKPRGIDDVPVLGVTLWSAAPEVTPLQLTQVAHALETELKKVPGTREVFSLGENRLSASVRFDPVKLNGYGIELATVEQMLGDANRVSRPAGLVQNAEVIQVQAGGFLDDIEQLKRLVVGVHQGRAVYLEDLAEIRLDAELPSQVAWHHDGSQVHPAVTVAVAKQPGVNAVKLVESLQQRLDVLAPQLLPDQVELHISRNYGETAAEKSNTLIGKLLFATLAVVALVLVTMGAREALIVGVAIAITLAITLFASWAWGFTLNRVSLFALIFSIGILVDDAIVVVENIHRHLQQGKRKLAELIPLAVDEVGGPTILATLTVIAALLPMAFVSGLMGPYMSPIPINASMGMLISLLVAFIISPWLSGKLLRQGAHGTETQRDNAPAQHETAPQADLSHRLFERLMGPLLHSRKARFGLWAAILMLIMAAVSLPAMQQVVLKMLPFDNKSEFQVMVDLPEGTPLETTQRLLKELADELAEVPEVVDMQLYAGTSAPINFNGLVRHYFLRDGLEQGDIQVNLLHKSERERDSHQIALSVRDRLQALGQPYDANIKVVEVPPGPPVWSPLVAEVYGPTQAMREQAAAELEQLFRQTEDVVDVDLMLPASQQQWRVRIDRQRAARLGVSHGRIVALIESAIGGRDAGVLHLPDQKYPVPIRLQLEEGAKVDLDQLLNLRLSGHEGAQIALSELVSIDKGRIDNPIMHKNMVPMVMLVADMAGPLDSPLYGMARLASKIDQHPLEIEQHLIEQPTGHDALAVLWDGEWKITYETFRDMGLAYAVGMVLIYLLVVAQFRSYLVPLIIMAPIPLTVIGVMPGHWLLGAQFTATSMIGMIALAGIIVRNSILLVDFINQETAAGVPFDRAVIRSGAVRAKPILLTALAAMIGALFILDDPIFNGLAISLIFGIMVSTLLTLIVIPVLYYAAFKRRFAG